LERSQGVCTPWGKRARRASGTFADGEPFLGGGGAVDLVELDEVVWTEPPDREETGSPNVVGAVALHAAIDALGEIGGQRSSPTIAISPNACAMAWRSFRA
jgi:selenocysteine lyase/cysteine desulfurase